MRKTKGLANEAAVEALAESLEAMAFVSLFPVEAPPDRVDDAVRVRIEFSGDRGGMLELIAPRELGRLTVAGIAPETPCSAAQAEDAIKEIANMVCGRILRSTGGEYDLNVPSANSLSTDEQWRTFINVEGAVVVNAEGLPVALCFTLNQ